jgi:hypothetical protein
MRAIAVSLLCVACRSGTGAPAVDAPAPYSVTHYSAKVVDENNAPVAGAQVCVPDLSNVACTTSDASGAFTFEIPHAGSTEYFAVTATLSGYLEGVTLGGNSAATVTGVDVVLSQLSAATTALGTQAEFVVPSTTLGYLTIAGLSYGASMHLADTSASGPVYGDDAGNPSPGLGSATSSGLVFFGNVTPGRVSATGLSSTGTGVVCYSYGIDDGAVPTPSVLMTGDWPPTGSASVDVFIVAGAWTTSVHVACLYP